MLLRYYLDNNKLSNEQRLTGYHFIALVTFILPIYLFDNTICHKTKVSKNEYNAVIKTSFNVTFLIDCHFTFPFIKQ